MQKKILAICPSRNRPEKCLRMVNSFLETSSISMLRVCIDMDDPQINKYMELLSGKVPLLIDFRRTTTEIYNNHWATAADHIQYLSCTNDDFVYTTKNWDVKLVESLNGGSGIAYGNDLLAGKMMPTTSIISKDIVKAVGWLQLPTLRHLYGDNVWQHIGTRAKCLAYNKDVIIEHLHMFSGKCEKDETVMYTNSPEMYQKDEAAFIKWLLNESTEDIRKVNNLLEKK